MANASRRARQFTTIKGTDLKVSKTVLTRYLKGSYSFDALMKSLKKYNTYHLRSYYADAGLHWKNEINNKGFTREQSIEYITASYRSQQFKYNPGQLLANNLEDIITKSLSASEIEQLKRDLGLTEGIDFRSWNWDSANKRLINPETGGWIQVHTVTDGDYNSDTIDWGK